MKAIVCVKQVPDTSGKVAVNPDGTLNRASMADHHQPRRPERCRGCSEAEGRYRLQGRCYHHGSSPGRGHAA